MRRTATGVRERDLRGGMPTVLRIGAARFFFYANEGDEAPHVHVQTGRGNAKLWLQPVRVASSTGLREHELRRLARITKTYQNELLRAWNGFFGF